MSGELLHLVKPAEDRAEAIQMLRDLLTKIEADQVKGFVATYDDGTHWRFIWGATYTQAVLLTDIAHDRAMERLKE